MGMMSGLWSSRVWGSLVLVCLLSEGSEMLFQER